MSEVNSNLFEVEESLLKEAKELIIMDRYNEKDLMAMFPVIVECFDKLLRDVEKIIKISDGQQEYLHRVQNDLKKEIEDRIRAEEKLKYMAAIDTLTGAYNRGMGLTFLEHELLNIKRNKGFFSLCYIDVNGLKYVNDNFGHCEGDELLLLICKFIKNHTRGNDILCRLGGDEFIILFPNTKEENVEGILSRIIANINIENEIGLKPYFISFSYGIVQADFDSTIGIDEIIQNADAKMYKYKQSYKQTLKK